MYPVGDAFIKLLGPEGKNRKITWFGSMVTASGSNYPLDTDTISNGSLKSDCPLPFVGGASSVSLQLKLAMRDVDPRTLENARIDLFVRLEHPETLKVLTSWERVSEFLWQEMATTTWNRSGPPRVIYTDIPMGVFYVTEAERSYSTIKIEAYDNMIRFNSNLPGMDSTSRSAYGWLKWACDACGVELGMTQADVRALPNGTRSFIYAVLDSDVKTYRYLLEQLAAALCAVALIDRTGKLVLKKLDPASVAEVTPDERFSSEYEDTKSQYTGLWMQYKTKAVQEYYKNVEALKDTGLIVDLGANPFLQISNDSARTNTLQTIADSFVGISFNPFKASIPCHPEYDLLDVLTFTGGHAPEDCHAPITSMTRTINGGVSIQCETPKEQVNPDRRNVQTEGVSGSRVSGGDFWIKVCSYPEEKLEAVDGQDYLMAELAVNCTTDNTTMQIAWTGFYTLESNARVTVRVFVDGENIYNVSDDQTAGNHVMNVTTGHSVSSKGEYVVKIALRVEVIE